MTKLSVVGSAELKTPTDLSAKEVAAVAAAVNSLIADAFSLYLKTKNFHWHLSGPHFRDFHLLFDEQAEAIFETIDVMAERVRKLGAGTIKSIGQVSRLQTITDDDNDFVPADEMVQKLLADNKTMAKALRAAIETCDENRDSPTGNILQEILDQTERRVWFLFETARSVEEK